MRLSACSPVTKDRNLSNILLSSEDDSDRASILQAQDVHKMTLATSTNLGQIISRATRSTTAAKRKSPAKKRRPPSKQRQPSRQVLKRSKRK